MRCRCANCGKTFQIRGAWGYAYGGLYVCSYRCMRRMKEEDSVTEEQKKIVDELEGKGLTAKAIAEKAGVNPQNVYDYQSRKRKAAGGDDGGREEKKPDGRDELIETMAGRYTTGWMCPMCKMIWNPYVSACNCQRKE